MQGNGTSPTFTASIGWIQKFMTRNGLCIWRKTTESQKDPEKLIDKLIAYVLQVRQLRVKFSYSDSDIITMDETAKFGKICFPVQLLILSARTQ